MAMIPLGAIVRDRHTGFTGFVTARTEYMYEAGCYRVESRELQGQPGQSRWFDVRRLSVVQPPAPPEPVVI